MLPETVLRTDDVAPDTRFDVWREAMKATMSPMDISSQHASDFWAHARLLSLDDVLLWPVAMQASRYRRTPKLIRQGDPELYHITLVLPGSGALRVEHDGRRHLSLVNDLYILDSSRPCDVEVAENELAVGIGVEIPRSHFPLAAERSIERIRGQRISGQEGFGAVLSHFLSHLVSRNSAHQPSDIPRLKQILLDLVTGLVTREPDAKASLNAETRQRNKFLLIRSYIQQHYRNPGLTPRAVAAAHFISPRQLHRLFEAEGITAAAYIRGRRLTEARRRLADPAQYTTSIQTIAQRCGYTSAAHFSRSFSAAYGMAPREYRELEHRQQLDTELRTLVLPPAADRDRVPA
ncbi:helix-turn-helix domain-containing protein [Streptomyces sp. NPDC059452]|uniref:helix-turn-helix domain-containing protein n=1 Tax=Streptomyces sp. NPDC059452 TaxID=3346835 RepID=UPI003673A9D6